MLVLSENIDINYELLIINYLDILFLLRLYIVVPTQMRYKIISQGEGHGMFPTGVPPTVV